MIFRFSKQFWFKKKETSYSDYAFSERNSFKDIKVLSFTSKIFTVDDEGFKREDNY